MAIKPTEYRNSYVLAHEVSYEVLDEVHKGSHAGRGMLQAGRVVWLKESPASDSAETSVTVYAEGIGLINVEPAALASKSY